MRQFFLLLVVVAALVFVVVPYFVLPAVLENLAARNVQDRLGLAQAPTVELDSDPQWEMLLGEFSGGSISANGLDLGGFRAERAAINVDEPFIVDVPGSVREQMLVVGGPVSGTVRLEVSEGEVLRLSNSAGGIGAKDIELTRDGATIEFAAGVGDTTFTVLVEGGVGVEGDALVFQPRRVRAAGVQVPEYIADSLLAESAFRYPVNGLPYGGTLTGAKTLEGAVVITGRVPNVDLGALPAG